MDENNRATKKGRKVRKRPEGKWGKKANNDRGRGRAGGEKKQLPMG